MTHKTIERIHSICTSQEGFGPSRVGHKIGFPGGHLERQLLTGYGNTACVPQSVPVRGLCVAIVHAWIQTEIQHHSVEPQLMPGCEEARFCAIGVARKEQRQSRYETGGVMKKEGCCCDLGMHGKVDA